MTLHRISRTCFALLLMASSCSDRPKGILSEDQTVEVMADMRIAEAYDRFGDAYGKQYVADRELIGRGVLMQHGISTEKMDSTLAWYGRNMDEYARLSKKVDQRLESIQAQYARAAGMQEKDASSADLWSYSHHFMIDRRSLADGIVASIQMPDIAPGDKLTWKMRVKGATHQNMTFGVDYEDGSSEIVRSSGNTLDKWIESDLQTDTILKVNRIFASVTFDSGGMVFVDSLQLLHQPFSIEEFQRKGFQRRVGAAARKIVLPPDSTENSSLTPDSISETVSSSAENSFGTRTRGKQLRRQS